MTALTIVPTRWYSWDFDVMEGTQRVARIDTSAWCEKGVLDVDGMRYEVYREGAMNGDFVLEHKDVVLARASKPSAFRNVLVVIYEGEEYTLRKPSMWRSEFVVERRNARVGHFSRLSMWSRRARVELPPKWPLALRVFVIWLAILLWKREADSSAVAAASA